MDVDDLNEWVRGQRDRVDALCMTALKDERYAELRDYYRGELSAFNRMLFELGVRRGA